MARSNVDRRLRTLARLVHRGREQQRYTHHALIVGTGDDLLLEDHAGPESSGPASVSARRPLWFDLASLTKPFATASSVLLLAQRRELKLSDPLRKFFPRLESAPLGALPVNSLLTHTSGLPAWLNLHAPAILGRARQDCLGRQPLSAPRAQYVYSDLGYLLLGDLIAAVAGRSVAAFAKKELFLPLAMLDTRFVPPPGSRPRCVPTELDPHTGKHWQGVVHDENCRAAGGISGHAGLFGTAADVARFARNLIAPRPELFLRTTRQRMRENQIWRLGGSSCGWFTPPNPMLPGGETFRQLGVPAFGHTGFTGTSLVIAPEQKLFIVLLTNRVYFGRRTPEFQALRHRVHAEFARLCAEWT